jgi:hypothetical protein
MTRLDLQNQLSARLLEIVRPASRGARVKVTVPAANAGDMILVRLEVRAAKTLRAAVLERLRQGRGLHAALVSIFPHNAVFIFDPGAAALDAAGVAALEVRIAGPTLT